MDCSVNLVTVMKGLTRIALSLLIICPGRGGGWGEGGRYWFNWAVASKLDAPRVSLDRETSYNNIDCPICKIKTTVTYLHDI